MFLYLPKEMGSMASVDYIISVMKKISSLEPVFFQRDGRFYAASADGFGSVDGLNTTPNELRYGETQLQEILESNNAIKEKKEQMEFIDGEEKYFKAFSQISHNRDRENFTIKSIGACFEKLAKLPDDGKIRMLRRSSSYHSHKYGYAADGMDFWVNTARVMDRDRYLQLLKEKENKLITEAEKDGKHEDLSFPNILIITPFLMFSSPRHFYFREANSWGQSTEIELRCAETDKYKESPFGFFVDINAANLYGQNQDRLNSLRHKLFDETAEQLDAVTSNIPILQENLDGLNNLHNKKFAKDVEWSKNLHKK